MKKKRNKRLIGCIFLRPILFLILIFFNLSPTEKEFKENIKRIILLQKCSPSLNTNFIKTIAPKYGIKVKLLKTSHIKWIQRNLKILYKNNAYKAYKKYSCLEVLKQVNKAEDLKKMPDYENIEKFLYLGLLKDIEEKLIPKLTKK